MLVFSHSSIDLPSHFSLLEDLNGISLERIHPDRPSHAAETWVSASENVQFASPGYQNSHFWSGGEGNAQIELEPQLFTPNNDGDKDLMHIHFNLDEGGWQSNIKIYNDRGMIIKNLISNYWIENKGSFEWDGSDDNKEMAKDILSKIDEDRRAPIVAAMRCFSEMPMFIVDIYGRDFP